MRPGPRDGLLAGIAISLLPLCVLALLAGAGLLNRWTAALSAAAVLGGSVALAEVWLADLFRLTQDDAVPAWWPWTSLAQALGTRRQAELAVLTQDRSQTRTDRAILDALPDPLLVLTHDRALTYANQAARDTLGNELSAVLRHPTLRAAIDRMQTSDGHVESVDLLLPVPMPRDLQATIIDLGNESPRARLALLFADRTRARAVERMRADFVANASHELRTPLASLIGFIETLRGPAADDTAAQQRFLVIMAEQAMRMNRLIDDLLSLSRIELTEHQAPAGRVDLAALLARTLSSFEPRRAQAGAMLRQQVQQDLPPVLADADQIEQVVQNLLDNALKYGRQGGVIEVRLGEAAGGRWPSRPGVVLSVRDEGAGIPRVHLPRLTERFYRVDRGRSRVAGGTGLGLAIVKHIVNRHRGQLAIDSEEGVGSTFSVWLPLAG
jgi:two-component system phosphate regulon sensor histidine kinase PhoR